MHKGKTYPYHPDRWSALAWFWPGYIPWKMRMEVVGVQPPPWNVVVPGSNGISEPGYSLDDGQSMSYNFALQGDDRIIEYVLTLDRLSENGIFARWRLSIKPQDGSPWATAYALQPYPQLEVGLQSFDYSLPSPPYTSAAGPRIAMRPANYAEGGDPWIP